MSKRGLHTEKSQGSLQTEKRIRQSNKPFKKNESFPPRATMKATESTLEGGTQNLNPNKTRVVKH